MIPMGSRTRRVDCRGRLVHPQRVRQPRVDHRARRRRARAQRARRRARPCGRSTSSRRRCRGRSSSTTAGSSRPATTRRSRPYALSIQPWTSGVPQAPGMWLQVELPQPMMRDRGAVRVRPGRRRERAGCARARRPAPGSAGGRGAPGAPAPPPPPVGYPRAFRCRSRWTARHGGRPVAKGQGTGSSTSVTFAPVRAKFVRITQTGSAADAPPWSMLRLRLYEASGTGPSQ